MLASNTEESLGGVAFQERESSHPSRANCRVLNILATVTLPNSVPECGYVSDEPVSHLV